MDLGRRVALFAANMSVFAILPFVVLPVTVHVAGSATWALVAVGQALGNVAAIAVTFGWEVCGPAMVAQLSDHERKTTYAKSLSARLWLAVPATAGLGAISWSTSEWPLVVFLSAMTTLLAVGLGSSWFYIGVGDPGSLMRYDTLPFAVAVALGATLSLCFTSITYLLVSQSLGAVYTVLVPAVVILRGRGLTSADFHPRTVIGSLREHASAAGAAATGGLYTSLPIPLLAVVDPAAVAAFAAADRVQKLTLSLARPVVQALQGWVPAGANHELNTRISRGMKVAAAVAVGAGAILAALTAPVVSLSTGGDIQVSAGLAICVGFAAAAIIASQVIGLACLSSLGLFGQVLKSTLVGAVTGLTLVALAGWQAGATEAWAALAAAESLVLVYQLVVMRRARVERAVKATVQSESRVHARPGS